MLDERGSTMQAEGDGIKASAEGGEEAALSLPPPNEILSSSDMILGKLVDEVEQKGFNDLRTLRARIPGGKGTQIRFGYSKVLPSHMALGHVCGQKF
jgi:hypothetical protein